MSNIILKGNTSGQVTIAAPDVGNNNTLTLPSTSSTLATQNSLGVRNLIINGDMRIAQRGTSVSGINTGSGYHAVDRWHLLFNGTIAGTWTMSQDTDVPTGQGFANSLKMDCTTAKSTLDAGSLLQFSQRFEGQMLQHLKYGTSNAEKLTTSFWVKSNKTGTYAFRLYNVDANKQINSSFTINTADTWEKKTITLDGDIVSGFDNDNNNSLIWTIYLVAGTNYTSGTDMTTWSSYVAADSAVTQTVNLADSTSNYINITGVQLEIGDTATPFEHRPYDMELQRCQRYFCKSYNYEDAIGTNTWDGTLAVRNFDSVARTDFPVNACFPVEMRANPTITAYSKSGIAGRRTSGGTSIDSSSSETINISFVGNSKCIRGSTSPSGVTAGTFVQAHYIASAEL